jgi:hypothetical protein
MTGAPVNPLWKMLPSPEGAGATRDDSMYALSAAHYAAAAQAAWQGDLEAMRRHIHGMPYRITHGNALTPAPVGLPEATLRAWYHAVIRRNLERGETVESYATTLRYFLSPIPLAHAKIYVEVASSKETIDAWSDRLATAYPHCSRETVHGYARSNAIKHDFLIPDGAPPITTARGMIAASEAEGSSDLAWTAHFRWLEGATDTPAVEEIEYLAGRSAAGCPYALRAAITQLQERGTPLDWHDALHAVHRGAGDDAGSAMCELLAGAALSPACCWSDLDSLAAEAERMDPGTRRSADGIYALILGTRRALGWGPQRNDNPGATRRWHNESAWCIGASYAGSIQAVPLIPLWDPTMGDRDIAQAVEAIAQADLWDEPLEDFLEYGLHTLPATRASLLGHPEQRLAELALASLCDHSGLQRAG